MTDVLKYTPLSDEEINQLRGTLGDGEHQFMVIKADIGHTKNGDPMIIFDHKIWDNEGREHIKKDWLPVIPSMMWKLKNYYKSIGEPEKYNGAFVASEQAGKGGILLIKQQKDNNGELQPRINNYIPPKNIGLKELSAKAIQEVANKSHEFDDEIPFG